MITLNGIQYNKDVKEIFFTPSMAKEIIDNKLGQNRPISRTTMNNYHNDMIEGYWDDSDRGVQPFIFDLNGNLRGGQHRIHALYRADGKVKGFKFPVIIDATENEIFRQGDAKNRSPKDAVLMHEKLPEFKNFSQKRLASIGLQILKFKKIKNLHRKDEPTVAAKELINNTDAIFEIDNAINGLDKHNTSRAKKFGPVLSAFIITYNKMDRVKWRDSLKSFTTGENMRGTQLQSLHEFCHHGKRKSLTAGRRPVPLFNRALRTLENINDGVNCVNLASENDVNVNKWIE